MLQYCGISGDEQAFHVIASGQNPPNPVELLSSARMSTMLYQLREMYDYIILDSPPVDLVVDAVALSSQCDGVLFVVRAHQSERGAVIHGMEQLEYAGANILGFVFNGVTAETASGYGKYRFRKYARNNRGYNRFYRYGYRGYGYGNYSYRNAPNDIPREQPVPEKQR